MIKNPFPVTGYLGPEYFCDRETELDRLTNAVEARRHTTIVALRRMGKTALLKHFFHTLSPHNFHLIYADLMPTLTLHDLINTLLSELIRAFPENNRFGAKIWKWVKSLRPLITFDPYTGMPTITVSTEHVEENFRTISEMFKILDQSGRMVIIALDEFQQITQYPEEQTQAWMRAQIQQLKNTVFIFSGSQQSLLQEMFMSAKRPFYSSSELLSLTYIDQDLYGTFIQNHFSEGKKRIGQHEIELILSYCRSHTYYVQTLCNRLFGRRERRITETTVRDELYKLLKEQETLYFTYRDLMTSPQYGLLKSMAKEGQVYSPTANWFIQKHRLGGAATVRRSLTTHLKNEMIFQVVDSEGKRYYQVYDVFFSRWLETQP